MKKSFLAVLSLALIALPSFPQAVVPPGAGATPRAAALGSEAPASQAGESSTSVARASNVAAERLMLAISSPEYPVTPSDVYHLVYRQSSGLIVEVALQVPGNSIIDLGLFGIIDASRMTFLELKDSVETIVAGSYSRSYPSLSIESVGIFRVGVGGAGLDFEYLTAWGLSRLGDIMNDYVEKASVSLRNIELTRKGAASETFDILQARRSPLSGSNPLLRPGDTITLHPVALTVRLAGEIRRPGTYELLPGEGLRRLIDTYGGGITEWADTSRLRIEKRTEKGSYVEYFDLQDAYNKFPDLQGCSGVTLFSREEGHSIIYFEGAVSAAEGDNGGTGRAAAPEVTMTNGPWISCPIVEGQRISDTIGFLRERLTPSADLSSATLIRAGSAPMTLDLAALMAHGSQAMDIVLKVNDRVYIPEVNSSITVSGAVTAPGVFAFQPTLQASYYITRAGGIDPERNNNGSYWVSDSNGKRKDPKYPLQGGDRIYVPANAFGYNVVRYLPVVTGVITLLVSIETLIMQLQGAVQ